ncbi:MAG: hypothetical protein IH868_11425 [Chloroflexi bacterium]|nr:hypothetical protein [Chloroflexota bacterium]
MRKRNLFQLFGLWISTIGLYGTYWFYLSSREMLVRQGRDPEEASTWTLMAPLPIINIRAYWQQSKLFEQTTGGKYPAALMLAIWMLPTIGIIVSPIGLIITQHELNKIAAAEDAARGGANTDDADGDG